MMRGTHVPEEESSVTGLRRSREQTTADGGRHHGKPPVYLLLEHVFGHGGVPRTSLNLAHQLAERGYDVEIVTLVQRRDEPFFPVDERVRVTVLADQRPPRRGPRPYRSLVRRLERQPSRLLATTPDADVKIASLWTDLLLRRKLRSIRSGVVIATRPALAVALTRWARPGVARVTQEHISFRGRNPRAREALRAAAAGLDALLTLTQEDRDLWRDALRGTDTEVRAIPNASPFDVGEPAALESRIVLAAGRLSHQKGFDRLVPAFATVARKFPDWQLHIYGKGPDEGKLKQAVREADLDGKVILKGLVPGLEQAFQDASIYAMSSRFEGLPMVLLEAMSKGVPIVSFDCPEGPRQLVEHGSNGLLVPEGDVDALGAALLRLVEDAEERRRMGRAGLEAARRYTADAVVGQWEELFRDLGQPR
jgi:glycosyltransferase involved in cell wall biosynthesis